MLRWWNKLRRLSRETPAPAALFAPAIHFDRQTYLNAVTVVAAKIAKVDGPVSRCEIDCFKRQFPVEAQESPWVGRLFDLARETPEGFQPFVQQLAGMVADDPGAAKLLFDRLHAVALADAPLTDKESDYLTVVARALGIEPHWHALRQRAFQGNDPYEVLGIPQDVPDREVRAAWQRLSRRYHPDAVAARGEGKPDHDRMAAINTAYRHIMRMRRQVHS